MMVRENELVEEPWGKGHPAMDGRVYLKRGVRLTHKPTGVSATSDYYSSRKENREEALVILMHRLDRLPGTSQRVRP